MKCQQCGCRAEHCGCCDGAQPLTPASVSNRPGLASLAYRVGTHGQFLSSMKARLSTVGVVAPGADGQTPETFRPLQGLTTRDAADPAIAMLDAWATVADVLSFYQERIANEGYLRTATERRSVLELGRLVGYAARPGVSATVYLSYTMDDKQLEPVTIAAGARAQSIPGPDELPQTFETSEPLLARPEWNDLQARRLRPQRLTLETTPGRNRLYVAETDSGLQNGDLLLFRYGPSAQQQVVRKVVKVAADFAESRSLILLQPLPRGVVLALPLLRQLLSALAPHAQNDSGAMRALLVGAGILASNQMGVYSAPRSWAAQMLDGSGVESGAELIEAMGASIAALPADDDATAAPTSDPDRFAGALLQDAAPQPANSLQLSRSLGPTFAQGADVQPQLLLHFAPRLKDSYYRAWRGSTFDGDKPQLDGISAMAVSGLLFGATAAKQPSYDDGVLEPQSDWTEWQYEDDELDDNAFLDKAYPQIAPGSHVLMQAPQDPQNPTRLHRRVLKVVNVMIGPRSAYGISGQATRLDFAERWRVTRTGGDRPLNIQFLRQTQFHAESQALQPAQEPLTDDVEGKEIELGVLHDQLKSGRWVIFDGERADIPGVSGVRASELMMVSGLRHGYDQTLPGDRAHTTLLLATPTVHRYRRSTLRIHGNVVKATHGETRNETLGSGNASQGLQSFLLRQPPLTYVPAPTAAGAESTLQVYVNDVQWREADTLAGLMPTERCYTTRTDDAGLTRVIFGNGEQGARPPTGVENVKAVYRNGIGRGGNVQAGQISLLASRPLGVREVINPLRASGGADKEGRDLIRDNAPRSVMALDRLVSVSDYADFTRMFAGIAKASAVRLSDRGRELLHLTIAGVDDMPIDPVSDLYRNLVLALRRLGDPGLALQLVSRELVALVLSANVRLLDGYRWEPVATALREMLLDRFGFLRRTLAQPALLCEVLAAMQAVRGVAYVDVDAFGGVPERRADSDGTRRLLTQAEISAAVRYMLDPGEYPPPPGLQPPPSDEVPAQRVNAAAAGPDAGRLRPAQLAIFTPAVPDTLILNQIP